MRSIVRGGVLFLICGFSARSLLSFRGYNYTIHITDYDVAGGGDGAATSSAAVIHANNVVNDAEEVFLIHNNKGLEVEGVMEKTVTNDHRSAENPKKDDGQEKKTKTKMSGRLELDKGGGMEKKTVTNHVRSSSAKNTKKEDRQKANTERKRKRQKKKKKEKRTKSEKKENLLKDFESSPSTTVSRDVFRTLVEEAQQTLQQSSVVASVYRSCEMHVHYILPNQQQQQQQHNTIDTTTAADADTGADADAAGKKHHEKFRLRFACLEDAANTVRSGGVGNNKATTNDEDPTQQQQQLVFQDDVCRTANICKVILDTNVRKTRVQVVTTPEDNDTTESDVYEKKKTKSVILTMVDSLRYLVEHDWLFDAFLNKASYAYRSDRPFFIWIGDLDKAELDKGNAPSIEEALGISYNPDKNKKIKVEGITMHYYKPIALLVLFEMLSSESELSRTIRSLPRSDNNNNNNNNNNIISDNSILFLDADTGFSNTAFHNIDNHVGPESYLAISPQASLIGSPNDNGNIVMNSGVIVLRDTKWMRESLVLWWHARSGIKDQLALWVVLFTTWSAWTTTTAETETASDNDDDITSTSDNNHGQQQEVEQFAYPSGIFDEYYHAFNRAWRYIRIHSRDLQSSWNVLTENHERMQQQQQQTNPNNSSSSTNSTSSMEHVYHHRESYDYPHPTNTTLHNGGPFEKLGSILVTPLELPHVLMLPHWRSTIIRKNTTNDSGLPYLVSSSTPDTDALVIHQKEMDSCSGGRCWPN